VNKPYKHIDALGAADKAAASRVERKRRKVGKSSSYDSKRGPGSLGDQLGRGVERNAPFIYFRPAGMDCNYDLLLNSIVGAFGRHAPRMPGKTIIRVADGL
jgi:hypothetical protein